MSEHHPDPESLLKAVQSTGVDRQRGRLKVFFGAVAGVGKTYSMLQEAQAQLKAGRDVVAGIVETHGRHDTSALLAGIPLLPMRQLEYHGVILQELDIGAALKRKPELLLVDELAHTNAPGSRHAKRWHDVEELLGAGIGVFTTVNVQHLESLNDVIEQITGVKVRETIPDGIIEHADEVELVDLAPEGVLQRLREGKVYIPAQAERAMQAFFTTPNLTALRELALLQTAQQVDTQLQAQRTLAHAQATWPVAERIIVCVSASPHSADLVRAARRLAREMHADWEAVYVETVVGRELPATARERLAATLRLAESLGGEAVMLSGDRVVDALVAYARQRNASKILVGKPTHPPWLDRLRGSLVETLIRQSGDIDVYVVRGQPTLSGKPSWSTAAPTKQLDWRGYLLAVTAVALCTAIASLLHTHLHPANLIMLYLLAVIVVSLRASRGPAVLAAFLAVATFDFFFVPPYVTFAVRDMEYLITFAVMLTVGLLVTSLTFRLRQQLLDVIVRERRTSALYRLSSDLTAQQCVADVVKLGEKRISELFHYDTALIVEPSHESSLELEQRYLSIFKDPRNETAVMQWVMENNKPAGLGTDTLPGAEALYLPLSTGRGVLGVLALKPRADKTSVEDLALPDRRHLLETCATLIAIALEREMQEQVRQQAEVQIERERLRSALLSSISHDLRTPLAGISGSVETLLSFSDKGESTAVRELLNGIQIEAERLSLLLENILEMTRLESGQVSLRLELQPLEEVVGSVLNAFEPRLRKREVTVVLPTDLPLVRVDAVLLERVLVNLLDNALKYTPESSPLQLESKEIPGWVVVSLADKGPGLSGIDLEQLFTPFSQFGGAGSTSVRGSRGLGLGLSICKAIIEAHGGTIKAEERKEGGSVFSFTIPAVKTVTSPDDPMAESAGEGEEVK